MINKTEKDIQEERGEAMHRIKKKKVD